MIGGGEKKIWILLFFIAFNYVGFSQSNEFVIGLYSNSNAKKAYSHNFGCEVSVNQVVDTLGFNTSVFNVISEDGFDLVHLYSPNLWVSINSFKATLTLVKNNNLKVALATGVNFVPSIDKEGNYLFSGSNKYDNCGFYYQDCQNPYSAGYFHPNLIQTFKVFNDSNYSKIIWGHVLSEEGSYFHIKSKAITCRGNHIEQKDSFVYVESIPKFIKDGIGFYKGGLVESNSKNHKIIISGANHHRSVHDSTLDHEGIYNPQDFMKILDFNSSRDIYFEGSFTIFPPKWTEQNYSSLYEKGPGNVHYLGSFYSVDYARKKVQEVHKTIACYVGTKMADGSIGNYLDKDGNGLAGDTHSDPLNIKNANWLWFQAYTSIIHGVNGVWFWWLPGMWIPGEDDGVWNRTTQQDRFERQYFPKYYRDYLAHLARELALLKSTGFLNKSDFIEIASKTDSVDVYGIVPEPKTYIPRNLPKEKCSENYGLRYSLRSNGKEAVLIISNPLNTAVSANLDFSKISNSLIQNSVGVRVLFENAMDVNSKTYKTDRNAAINLETATVEKGYYLPFQNKQLLLDFGPMDVHVLKFVIDSNDQNFTKKFFQLYPNPANEYVVISSLLDLDILYGVEIYNSIGQKIFEQSGGFATNEKGEIQLATSTLASGTYYVQIKGNAFVEVLPLIIKR